MNGGRRPTKPLLLAAVAADPRDRPHGRGGDDDNRLVAADRVWFVLAAGITMWLLLSHAYVIRTTVFASPPVGRALLLMPLVPNIFGAPTRLFDPTAPPAVLATAGPAVDGGGWPLSDAYEAPATVAALYTATSVVAITVAWFFASRRLHYDDNDAKRFLRGATALVASVASSFAVLSAHVLTSVVLPLAALAAEEAAGHGTRDGDGAADRPRVDAFATSPLLVGFVLLFVPPLVGCTECGKAHRRRRLLRYCLGIVETFCEKCTLCD